VGTSPRSASLFSLDESIRARIPMTTILATASYSDGTYFNSSAKRAPCRTSIPPGRRFFLQKTRLSHVRLHELEDH